MPIAHAKQRFFLPGPQLIRCPIPSSALQKSQRTIIEHQVMLEKFGGGPESFCEQTPQAKSADFRPWTIESGHQPLGMFLLRFEHVTGDAQPIAHRGDFTK